MALGTVSASTIGHVDALLLLLQVLLAAVFVTAGVAKLLDQPGSRSTLEAFGVPAAAVGAAGMLLPLAEIATAVALVFEPIARWGALAALLLLLAFMSAVARAMSRGQAPDCHCFGQLHSAPAGRGTLVRNGILATVGALVLVAGPGAPIDAWVSDRTTAELVAVLAGLAAVLLGGSTLRLWRENRTLRRDVASAGEIEAALPPGLPIGARAPGFSVTDMNGEAVTLDALLSRFRPVALVFVSPLCGPCESLLPDLPRWQRTLNERLTIAVISHGSAEANRPMAEEYHVDRLLLASDQELLRRYRLHGTPATVIVGSDGRISAVSAHGAAVEPTIRAALDREPEPRAPQLAVHLVGAPHSAERIAPG